ncbi:MAG: lysoplasmalogenase [Bacteroidota bacterium]
MQSFLKKKRESERRWFIWAYILFGVCVVLSREIDQYWLHYVSKPLIMLSLLWMYVQKCQQKGSRQYRAVLLAILASWLGDICLMFGGKIWFLSGLSFFLLAHLGYIYAFFQGIQSENSPSILKQKPWLLLPFLLYAAALFRLVLPQAGEMAIPIVVYAIVILGMALSGLNRKGRVSEESFRPVLLGALLFMLSDSMIAIHRFAEQMISIPAVQLWIMFTYMSAQYLIITGLLKEE